MSVPPRVIIPLAFCIPAAFSGQTQYERATAPFFHSLQRSCPARNLHFLPPAVLNQQIERFEPSLSPRQDRRYKQAAAFRCKSTIAGATCQNLAFLSVARRERFLSRFARFLCAQPLTCKGPGQCQAP